MTLKGLRVGVIADRKGAELCAALSRGGAQVTWGPTLSTVAPERDELIAAETEDIVAASPAWVVVSTGTGLNAWLESADAARCGDEVRDLLRKARTVARGAKSHGALRALGIEPVFVSPQETMDDVCAWLLGQVEPSDTLAVQVHGGEVVGTLGRLRPKVRQVLTVAPYRWVLPADTSRAEELVRRLIDGSVDVLAATSAPTVRNLFVVALGMGADAALVRALRERVCVAAVGPVTARAFEEAGVGVGVMPARSPRTGDLIRAIDQWAQRRADDPVATEPSGPLELVPGANAVRIGAQVVVLGRQEFAVLAAMVRRPGVVLRPEMLAMQAWGHRAPGDASAVKHQVARIRQKLGAYGRCVQTVRSVGYRYAADAVDTPTGPAVAP